MKNFNFHCKSSDWFSFSLLFEAISTSSNAFFENIYTIFINGVIAIVAYGLMRNFSHLQSRIYVLDNIVYVIALIFVANIFWISRFVRSSLLRIFGTLSARGRNRKFAQFWDFRFRSYLIRAGGVSLASLTVMCIFPIFVAIFTDEKLGSTATLLFPCWFPWSVDTVSKYVVTIVLQLVVGGILYSIAIGMIITQLCCLALVKAQSDYFCHAVARMDDNTSPATCGSGRICQYKPDEHETKEFNSVVAHYQHMFR